MNSVWRFALVAGLLAGVALSAAAQDNAKVGVTTLAGSKFGPLPGLPACATLSVQRGDPTKGAAVILIKMTSGCKIPWHWHTANEALAMVGGKAKLEMKNGTMSMSSVSPGDYVYLPGKHVHQFTCLAACTLFDLTEGAFDIHYVDQDGKEIPPDQALKPAAKPAAAKK